MKKNSPRRAFLRTSAIAISGVALLTPSALDAFTNASSPFDGYNEFAEEKNDLRVLLNEEPIRVSGTIFDHTGITPLSNSVIEVWHLSPNSSKYRHRGKLKTDENGAYSFITDFPNKEKGKASRIYFKVSKNNNSYFTELPLSRSGVYLTPKHWEENKHLKNDAYPKREQLSKEIHITFNISINKN